MLVARLGAGDDTDLVAVSAQSADGRVVVLDQVAVTACRADEWLCASGGAGSATVASTPQWARENPRRGQ